MDSPAQPFYKAGGFREDERMDRCRRLDAPARLDIGAARVGTGPADGNRSQSLATSTPRRRKRRPTIFGRRRTISDEPWVAGLLAQNIHEGFFEESSTFSGKTCGATPPRVDIDHDEGGLQAMLNASIDAKSRPRAAQAAD